MVKVLNYKPFSIVLKKRTKIASVIPPKSIAAIHRFQTPETQEKVPTILEQTPDVLEQFAKDYKLDLNPNLTSDQRHTLLNVMYQYKGVFARSLRDVQIYRGMELDLELKNPKVKSYTRQYPLSQADADEVDHQIQELCEAGLVRENNDCSWNSPVFVVSKKNHSKRMVVDLRKVNALLKPIITLLPKIDDLLQQISALNPVYMTTCERAMVTAR